MRCSCYRIVPAIPASFPSICVGLRPSQVGGRHSGLASLTDQALPRSSRNSEAGHTAVHQQCARATKRSRLPLLEASVSSY